MIWNDATKLRMNHKRKPSPVFKPKINSLTNNISTTHFATTVIYDGLSMINQKLNKKDSVIVHQLSFLPYQKKKLPFPGGPSPKV